MQRQLFIVLAMFCTLSTTACSQWEEPSRVPAGVTPGSLSFYGSQWIFVDAFKQSRPWASSVKAEPLVMDPEGWVRELKAGQHAWTVMHSHKSGLYSKGQWVCLYDGSGELKFNETASVVESKPNRILLEVNPDAGELKIELTATDPKDPLRNIRLIPKSFLENYEAEPFHPLFLEMMKGFDVVRFTGLMKSGHPVPSAEWNDRVLPSHQTQAGKGGMALEYAVDLCRRLEADAWFTMPVNADKAYFRQFALYLREHLPADAKVYVEYGDDVGVWPTASSQYCLKKGREMGISEDWTTARNRYYARRSSELFAVWEEVFESQDRLITVLNPLSDDTCKWDNAAEGADAAGMVTLFGQDFGKLQNIDHLLATDLDTLMDELTMVASINDGVKESIERAERFNLEPMSFYMTPIICPLGPIEKERGADVQKQVEAKTLAMLEHPRMEPIFRQFIQSWIEAGGGLWIHSGLVHQPGKWGWFGLLKRMDESPEESPKFRAVRNEMELKTQ
jgi:hypothetical protein